MGKKIGKIALLILLFASLGMMDGQVTGPLQPLNPPPSAENGEMIDETPSIWFVELSGLPTADGGKLSVLGQEKAAFRKEASRVRLKYNERFAFDTLWNGLSVEIQPGELAKLSRISGVKALYPVETISVPEERSSEYIELATALAMTGADVVHSELGYTGAGVRVGIIDTGIDYDHPDLGGCFGPGCRVETGWDFVGDAYDSSTNPVPVPDPDPDDCAGHGTHVAGIVGAGGAVTGVAPGVTFGAYRVFGCAGTTSADIMIAAMERALADGMDIVNMSIGSGYQWPQYPTAQAGDRLVNKGVVVVCSIGNNGANGLYAAGAPGVGKKVIGCAAFDNTHQNFTSFTISPDDTPIGYANASAAPPAPLSGTYPMARTGTSSSTADACSALPAGSLAGQVVLIRRGGCTFHVKSLNAQNAGAVAVVLYNNAAGRFSPTVAGTPPITIPVVAISGEEGVLVDDRLAAGPVNMTWTDDTLSIPFPTGGLIGDFSSYGLPPELSVKPDIGAPGRYIYSTYPIENGSYASLYGTSMASPHVAGAAALLLEAHPHTPAQIVRTILQNSADPKPWWGNPGLGFLDNVHRQGAGMLDIDDAILATTKIEPGKIAAGEGEYGPYTQTLTIENKSYLPITYDLSFVNALSTGGVIPPSFWLSDAYVAFSSSTVTVPADGTATVNATIYPATYPTYGLYGGYIVFTPQGGGQIFRVPFAGFVGDYQSIVALTPTPYGFPWLAKLIGTSYFNQPAGATYTMVGDDIPFFLIHLDHQVRRLRMEVFSVKGKNWHRAFDYQYVPRNSTTTSFFAFDWDGYTMSGRKLWMVPDGQYVVKLSVLKALGDDNNPAHWETWTSPVITIDRP